MRKSKRQTILTILISLASLLSILMLIPYIFFDHENKELTPGVEKSFGYQYIQLDSGVTHYQLSGPENGQVVVMIPGFSIPLHDWDFQNSFLSESGFRVLRYDHFGRGFSDRPDTDYNKDTYIRQLDELLTSLNLETPLHLIGHSFGAAVAAEYAVHYPRKIDKLIMIAPMLNPAEDNFAISLVKLPVIGTWFVRVAGIKMVRNRGETLFTNAFDDSSQIHRYRVEFGEQFQYKGTARSIVRLFRNGAFGDYSNTYKELDNLENDILIIFGDNDSSISKAHSSSIKEIFKNGTYRELPDGCHSVNLQKPEEVNSILYEFLN